MPTHARRGHPVKVGARTGPGPGGAALRAPGRHVRVPAPCVDPLVQLPALIRPRPRLERLLDHRTFAVRQIPGRLPLARTIGRLLGGRGGRVWAYRHACRRRQAAFPLHTRRIQAWSPLALRRDPGVTIWDGIAFLGCCMVFVRSACVTWVRSHESALRRGAAERSCPSPRTTSMIFTYNLDRSTDTHLLHEQPLPISRT
jgi:hypothetical protein